MCTVVTRWQPGEPLRILALRDELVSRAFDLPAAWWSDRPDVIGGRDRTAGGSWCVSDVRTGVTALVLNRTERRTGTPSRGVLPLAAVSAGDNWPDHVPHQAMASFTLVLAAPDAVTAWTWDASELRRIDLDAGAHMMTPAGVDPDDARARAHQTALSDDGAWLDVVGARTPSDDPGALVVRHETPHGVYATVFGQLITSTPGSLRLEYSRTPWERHGWLEQAWP